MGCLPVSLSSGDEVPTPPVGEEPPAEEEPPAAEEPPVEEAGVRILIESGSLLVAEGGSSVVDVRLTSVPAGPMTVRAEIVSGSDVFGASPSELTFTTSDWDAVQPVTITAAIDSDLSSQGGVLRLTLVGGADETTVALTQEDRQGDGAVDASEFSNWAEGTAAADDGATRDFFNSVAGFEWKHSMGDYEDANGVDQGSTPFATASFNGDLIEFDVTGLVRAWADKTVANKGFHIRGASSWATLVTRENGDASKRPVLEVTTASGTVNLAAAADTYLDASTYQGFGDLPTMTLSSDHTVLVRFDLDAVSGTVTSARLRLYATSPRSASASVYCSNQGGDAAAVEPTYGIAKSYVNDANIGSHPDVYHFESFESENWVDGWTYHYDAHTSQRITSDAAGGFAQLQGAALKVTIAQGGNKGLNLSYSFAERTGSEPTEAFFRYYLRVSTQWRSTQGGKLPGFAGTYGVAGWGGRTPDGTDGWSARGAFMVSPEGNNPLAGTLPIGNYVYYADQPGIYGDIYSWDNAQRGVLERSRWYSIEQQVKLNTPGQSNGLLRAWVDGRLAFEKTGINYRLVDTLKIEQVWMNVYHGGLDTMPIDSHLYMDNVVIAKSYIGPIYTGK